MLSTDFVLFLYIGMGNLKLDFELYNIFNLLFFAGAMILYLAFCFRSVLQS